MEIIIGVLLGQPKNRKKSTIQAEILVIEKAEIQGFIRDIYTAPQAVE